MLKKETNYGIICAPLFKKKKTILNHSLNVMNFTIVLILTETGLYPVCFVPHVHVIRITENSTENR